MSDKEENRQLELTATEYTCMAKGYFGCGLFTQAAECIDNACYLYRWEEKDFRSYAEYADCLRMRAYIYGKEGQKKDSKKAYRAAEKIWKSQGDKKGYADCLIEKGMIELGRDRVGKSIRLQQKALKILEGVAGAEGKRAKAYYQMGVAYYNKNKDTRAEKCFSEAVKGTNDVRAYLALGCAKVRLKKYEEGLQSLFCAQKICEEENAATPYNKDLGEIYLLIGDVYIRMDAPFKAIKFYARALKVYEMCNRVEPEPMYATTLLKMYLTYDKMGEEQNAANMLRMWEQTWKK